MAAGSGAARGGATDREESVGAGLRAKRYEAGAAPARPPGAPARRARGRVLAPRAGAARDGERRAAERAAPSLASVPGFAVRVPPPAARPLTFGASIHA